jgi:methylglutaconyl-CoA hydratase
LQVTAHTLDLDVAASGMATITLNRPDRGNAINQMMLDELADQLASLAVDNNVRAIVLRGNGQHFCTGADIRERMSGGIEGAAPAHDLTDVLRLLDESPKFTVAAVHGACVGAGFGLAACCDLVMATDEAFFSIPEVRLGIAPTLTPLFVRAIGIRAFRRYGLTGERIAATEGMRIGLVHELVSTIDDGLYRLIDEVQKSGPLALAATKAMAADVAAVARARVFPSKSERSALDLKTPEAAEGIAAFREKRKPNWYRK